MRKGPTTYQSLGDLDSLDWTNGTRTWGTHVWHVGLAFLLLFCLHNIMNREQVPRFLEPFQSRTSTTSESWRRKIVLNILNERQKKNKKNRQNLGRGQSFLHAKDWKIQQQWPFFPKPFGIKGFPFFFLFIFFFFLFLTTFKLFFVRLLRPFIFISSLESCTRRGAIQSSLGSLLLLRGWLFIYLFSHFAADFRPI